MTSNDELKVIDKAARKALVRWGKNPYGDILDELKQDLHVWYLESPSVQTMVLDSDEAMAVHNVTRQAMNILAGQALQLDVFNGVQMYSQDEIKSALKHTSTNKYLVQVVLPLAMENLDAQEGNEYAEAIRSRYDDGRIPVSKYQENQLVYAHQALTKQVNIAVVAYQTNDEHRPRPQKEEYDRPDANGEEHLEVFSPNAADPDAIKADDGHSDKVGDLATNLVVMQQVIDGERIQIGSKTITPAKARKYLERVEGWDHYTPLAEVIGGASYKEEVA